MTPWTVARQAPLSMEFSRQEYWSGLLFPSPGDLPHRGIEPGSPALQADSLPTESLEKPRKLNTMIHVKEKKKKNTLGQNGVYSRNPRLVQYLKVIQITRQSGWLLSKSLQAINAGEGVEKREPSYTVGGNAN